MSSQSPKKKKAKSKGPAPSYLRDARLSHDGARHPENRSKTSTARRPNKSSVPADPRPASGEVVELSDGDDLPTLETSSPDLYGGGDFSRQVIVIFKSMLNKNQHADNPHTHNKAYFKSITDKLIASAPPMMLKSREVDLAKGYSGKNP